LPLLAVEAARELPEVAYLQTPYLILTIAMVACVQVALVAIWRLLTLVRRGAIFSDRAYRWVDVVIGAALTASAIAIGLLVHLSVFVNAGPPLVVLALFATATVGLTVALLVVVMRGLLRQATALEGELAEVV
ncbi:MAG TPA: DUF2975 domain-containing protein, partial [Terrimesophilobacter sp.]|nr:DUF2975 domain-containing protein [Terrimesophilobacter sp.]